jgi:hypothetical protein
MEAHSSPQSRACSLAERVGHDVTSTGYCVMRAALCAVVSAMLECELLTARK